jgi:hypothetical protein
MKIKAIVIIAFTIGLNAHILGQTSEVGALKGKVIDKITKQTLLGATVFIKGSQIGTSTDTAGTFVFINIDEGTYSIVVSYVGYQGKNVNDVQIIRNKTNYIEIEIEEAATSLEEITVTASRFENTRLMNVSNYDFSREEISRNPGAQGDIFRAIGMLPGVSSSGGEYSAIAVRGQGTRDNIYIVDDIPITEVGHLEGSTSGFNDPNGGRFSIFAPRVIDNAEFLGGGFSSQYGRRSASYLGLGIKEGNNENPIVDGQLDLMGLTINYDGPGYIFNNTSLFFSARYQDFKPAETITDLLYMGLPKYQDYIFKSTSQIGTENKLSLIAIYSPETYIRNTENIKEDDELNMLFVADVATSKTILGINLRTLAGKNSYFKNILYYTNTMLDNSYGNSFPQIDSLGNLINADNIPFEDGIRKIKYTESKFGFRSIYSIRFENSSNLTAGIDLDRVELDNQKKLSRTDTSYVFNIYDFRPDPFKYYQLIEPAFYNVDVNKSSYNASAYINYSFSTFNKLSINAGVRYDYTGFTDQQTLSPRLSGGYHLDETNSLNFAAGIFYQDPIYSEIADQPENKKLKNEKVTELIIGYKKYFAPDLKLTVESWYKKFSNMIVRPVSGQVEQNNSGDGYAYGFDINFTKRLVENVHGQIGYSYMQSKRNDHNSFGEYNFDFSQPHQINFLISYKPNEHWVLATKFRYATGKPKYQYIIHNNIFNDPNNIRYSEEITAENKDRLPDFISLDIRADYRFQVGQINLTAFIDIVDVLNRQNVNGESFNYIRGKTYYDGISIFPSFGLKFQL